MDLIVYDNISQKKALEAQPAIRPDDALALALDYLDFLAALGHDRAVSPDMSKKWIILPLQKNDYKRDQGMSANGK